MPDNFKYRKPEPYFENLSAEPQLRSLSNFVLGFTTNKMLGLRAGTFEITLTPQVEPYGEERDNFLPGITKDNFESFIYQNVRPMDAVIVGIRTVRSDGTYGIEEIMFGFVDNVAKSKTIMNRNVVRSITVRGRDATKLFIDDNVAYAPELATDKDVRAAFGEDVKRLDFLNYIRGLRTISEENPIGKSIADNVFINKPIPVPVYWVLQNIPAMRLNIDYFGDGNKRPYEIFKTSLTARREDRLFDANMNMYAGSVANYFNQLIDPDFHELWVDTMPASSLLNEDSNIAKPVFILRPKPFDRRYEIDTRGNKLDFNGIRHDPDVDKVVPHKLLSWEDVTSPMTGEKVEIPERAITRKSLGIADYEVYTQYKLFSQQDILAASPVGRFGWYMPLLDVNMFQAYGVRELVSQSRLLPYASDVWNTLSSELDEEDKETGNNVGNADGVVTNGDAPVNDLDEAIEGIDSDDGRKKSILEFLTVERRDRIWRWNRYNHILESGQLTFEGRNVFVGSKVILPDEPTRGTVMGKDDTGSRTRYKGEGGMEYYCEGVRQQYGFGNPWTTTLRLTRGHNHAELQTYHNIVRSFHKKPGKANNIFVSNKIRLP